MGYSNIAFVLTESKTVYFIVAIKNKIRLILVKRKARRYNVS